jgi:hypothetical protein
MTCLIVVIRTRPGRPVGDTRKLLGSLIRTTVWSEDRSRDRLDGSGFWLDMSVDAENVNASGDISILGGILGGPLRSVLNQIVQETVQEQLR